MLEYTRMNSTFKPSSEILWATGLSSLLTKQRLGITAKKKLRMFCTNYTQSSTYNSFFCPSSKMLWFWNRRHRGYSSFKLYTFDIAVISLLCCQIIWSCQDIKYINLKTHVFKCVMKKNTSFIQMIRPSIPILTESLTSASMNTLVDYVASNQPKIHLKQQHIIFLFFWGIDLQKNPTHLFYTNITLFFIFNTRHEILPPTHCLTL